MSSNHFDIGNSAVLLDYHFQSSPHGKSVQLHEALRSFGKDCGKAAERAAQANGAIGIKTPDPLLKYICDMTMYFADDPGRPNVGHWARHMMPYGFDLTADGRIIPFNRQYQPIHAPIGLVFSPGGIGGVWHSAFEDQGRFYLYEGNDLSPDYFARLATIASLETGVHPHVKATRHHARFHDFRANRGRCMCDLGESV